jgi:D-lyxose ketol-isomerase
MKRSEINQVILQAINCFTRNGWVLPPRPRWDVTDFGLNDFRRSGLVLVNLAEEKEYCEKLIYAMRQQLTPAHCHQKKKEDIICRNGELTIKLWLKDPADMPAADVIRLKVNGEITTYISGMPLILRSGERVTIEPGLWHEFYPGSEECIIGEVSTVNDDLNDNFFSNKAVGRFSTIIEDEAIRYPLINETPGYSQG